MSAVHATLADRRLRLATGDAGDDVVLDLPLDQGGRHRLVAPDGATAAAAVAALEALPGVGVLPANGGLLGALTVAENFHLVLRYDETDTPLDVLDPDLDAALALCGLAPERIAALGRARPLALDRVERWTLGFARHLLRPPELLVIDRAFAGLARAQADALAALQAVYHRRHPFRPALFVDLDSHELPALADCRHTIALAETPCHC